MAPRVGARVALGRRFTAPRRRSASTLQAEPHAGVAREPLQVGNAGEHDRGTSIIGVELMRALRAGRECVLERIGACGRDAGGDDRSAGEGDLDADGFR